jgi:tetratricopeptide (TPR) repeat protein
LLGNYMNIETYRMFKIISKNGSLAIDIPGRMVLELNPPDENGRFFPKMTREISLAPGNISEGKAEKINMQQYFRLRKTSIPDSVIDEIPVEFREFAGDYQFAQARLSLDVRFVDGTLTTREPFGKSTERISYHKTGDTWTDKNGVYEIGFISGNDSKVTALNFTAGLEFRRGEPVTNAIEPVIKISGVDAGLKKYDEIKNSVQSDYLFSEHMLHQLGHNLLNEGKMEDAIKIFEKNVHEYPESFITNDALAETCLKKGDKKQAVKYFKIAVKLDPDYEYGRKMIDELKGNKKKE